MVPAGNKAPPFVGQPYHKNNSSSSSSSSSSPKNPPSSVFFYTKEPIQFSSYVHQGHQRTHLVPCCCTPRAPSISVFLCTKEPIQLSVFSVQWLSPTVIGSGSAQYQKNCFLTPLLQFSKTLQVFRSKMVIFCTIS